MDVGTILAITQASIIGVALIIGFGVFTANKEGSPKFIWGVARAVVVYLPFALAWFTVMAAMFFENGNLMIPLLVGVCAIVLNFGADWLLFKSGFQAFNKLQ